MHGGKTLVLFSYSRELLSGDRKTLTHVYNIYRYSAVRKNNYYFERKLPKNLVD